MRYKTDEILYHGDFIKKIPAPVYSADFQPQGDVQRLATCGADVCVRLWRCSRGADGESAISHLADLEGHAKAVNVVRWNPDGTALLSGSDDGMCALWRPQETRPLGSEAVEAWGNKKSFACHSDVYDVAWSPDGTLIFCAVLAGWTICFSVDSGRMVDRLEGHGQRVQGIAADPLGVYLASVSADRSVRVYGRRKGPGVKWSIHHVVRGERSERGDDKKENERELEPKFLSENAYEHFYRRMAWSPDGALLAVPSAQAKDNLFCTVLLKRSDLSRIAAVLQAPAPPVCVRFSPELAASDAGHYWVRGGHFRVAVATARAVYVYDTGSADPVAFFQSFHYSSLSDITWTPDARTLAMASTDGYVSYVDFEEDETDPVIERTPVKHAEKVEASTPAREPRPKELVRRAKEAEDSASASGTRESGESGEGGSARKRNRRVSFEVVSPVSTGVRLQLPGGSPSSSFADPPFGSSKRRKASAEVQSDPK
jgi:chromatin assembly factor 1 subunit B